MRRFSILIFLFGFIYDTQCFFIPIRFGNPFKIINKEVKKVIEYNNDKNNDENISSEITELNTRVVLYQAMPEDLH